MTKHANYREARDLLISLVQKIGTERTELEKAAGRILAGDLLASENVPAFDRSPYDGYAFRAEDSAGASEETPVTLQVIEEIPAGSVPSREIVPGTAAKILTGAPIPQGADAVVMYEKTEFTADAVTLFAPASSGDNIVYAGEDVKKGEILAAAGTVIDAGLAGTLAAQGIGYPEVFQKPLVGMISTGSELVEASEEGPVPEGKIRNTNRYTIGAALQKDGCIPVYLGKAGDDVSEIARLIRKGLEETDLVVLTGGVSAGDYDLTPQAMEAAGCEILIHGVDLKPGMACCYGMKDGKAVCALSGNPSSSILNYYTILRPAVRKMTGLMFYMPDTIKVTLAEEFGKKSKTVRLLKGRLSIENGQAVMHLPKGQGNIMIGSSIGCNVLAVVPAGTGKLEAGTVLDGFQI